MFWVFSFQFCIFVVTFTTENGWLTGATFLAYCKRFLNHKSRTVVVLDLFSAHRCEISFELFVPLVV
jgi:hypothetical protein